jgi:hypothetical protein
MCGFWDVFYFVASPYIIAPPWLNQFTSVNCDNPGHSINGSVPGVPGEAYWLGHDHCGLGALCRILSARSISYREMNPAVAVKLTVALKTGTVHPS